MSVNDAVLMRHATPIPAEGDDGEFSQTWYPVCLSSEVGDGEVIGRELIGGRVVVFRDENGAAAVLSAFCAHMGVDLKHGKVIHGEVRCPYHHFQYNTDGHCTKVGGPETPPKNARLFRFPVKEKYGVIFAFNGMEPLWELPSFSQPENEIMTHAWKQDLILEVDPWVVKSQTADLNHAAYIHGGGLMDEKLPEYEWNDYGYNHDIEEVDMGDQGKWHSLKIRQFGTTCGIIEMYRGDVWSGTFPAYCIRRPGKTELFGINAVSIGDGSEETRLKAGKELELMREINTKVLKEDATIYENYRPVQGAMLECDKELVNYYNYIRRYPRANPGKYFINGEAPMPI